MQQQQPGLYRRPIGLALPATYSGTVTCAPPSDTIIERGDSKPVAHMVECSLPCAEGKIVVQDDERNETPDAPAGTEPVDRFDQTPPEYRAAERPADEGSHHRLSQYRMPLSPTK